MKESYREALATHSGPEPYAGGGNTVGVATAGVHAGPEIELRYSAIPRADMVQLVEGNIEASALASSSSNAAESKAWSMCGNFKHENREIPKAPGAATRLATRTISEPHRGQD